MALPLVAATNISTPTSPAHYSVRLRHANSANRSVQTIGSRSHTCKVSTCHFYSKAPTNLCSTLCFSKKACFVINHEVFIGFPRVENHPWKQTCIDALFDYRKMSDWFKTAKAANRQVKKRMLRWSLELQIWTFMICKPPRLGWTSCTTTITSIFLKLPILPNPINPHLQLCISSWQ